MSMSAHSKRFSILFIGSIIGGGLLGIGLFSIRRVIFIGIDILQIKIASFHIIETKF
jgi:hypothetical protein